MTPVFRLALITSLLAVAVPGDAQRRSRQAPAQSRSLTMMPETRTMVAFEAAWARADAEALSGLFEENGRLVVPAGTPVIGRATIRDFYAVAFNSGYRGSKGDARIVRVTRLNPGMSLVEGSWTISGAKRPDGKARPAETGRFSAVVRDGADGWRLIGLSETR